MSNQYQLSGNAFWQRKLQTEWFDVLFDAVSYVEDKGVADLVSLCPGKDRFLLSFWIYEIFDNGQVVARDSDKEYLRYDWKSRLVSSTFFVEPE
jgi:hypothetical protein